MRPKTRLPPCRFCKKQFQRTEHLLRHERTHTKEKPYACSCGKKFSRRDLMLRHIRVSQEDSSNGDHTIHVEQNDPPRQHSESEQSSAGLAKTHDVAVQNEGAMTIDAANTSLDLNIQETITALPNEAPSTPATALNYVNPTFSEHRGQQLGATKTSWQNPETERQFDLSRAGQPDSNDLYIQQSRFEPKETSSTDYLLPGFMDDLDLLWGDIDMHSMIMQPGSYPLMFPPFSDYGIANSENTGATSGSEIEAYATNRQNQLGALSRYGSRLPSVQPEVDPDREGNPAVLDPSGEERATGRAKALLVPWRISRRQYSVLAGIIEQHSALLPNDFQFPSRHALSRYVEGYFNGFHEHLPFLHMPTISMDMIAPELMLAIAATGAQYRFQRPQAYHLYQASKALVDEQILQREKDSTPLPVLRIPNLLSNEGFRSNGMPTTTSNTTPLAPDETQGVLAKDGNSSFIETMQAMLLLISLGTWNHRLLLGTSLAMASKLAWYLRQDGLSETHSDSLPISWEQWLHKESLRRMKMVAYSFFNLHSIAYNVPPKIMNSELDLKLPCPESQWKAANEEEWTTARLQEPYTDISFRTGYNRLFASGVDTVAPSTRGYSSFGNFVLIHAILQYIFFARQASQSFGSCENGSFEPNSLKILETALRRWQRNWESTKDSSFDPASPGGPLSFNSIALLRIAYIRLHADLGPCRQLQTRDPNLIACAFRDAPHLARSPSVCRAVLQSAHSLSIPVRIGIEFVAHTQSLSWSIVHSLSNLECAVFLSQWLNCISIKTSEGQITNASELRLLDLIQSILGETELSQSIKQEENLPRRYKRMAAAVVRLWAETFKGAHVFEIMQAIGAGLDLHANMLEAQLVESG